MATKNKLGLLGRSLKHVFGNPVAGYDEYGPTERASLSVGPTAGLSTGPVPEGKEISTNKVASEILALRAEQVGFASSATLTATEGRYKGIKEPSMRLDFYFDGSDGTPAKFKANIKKLAERAAKKLGQREILIEYQARGNKTTTATASPEGAPAATSPKFCDWVRRNSKSAQTNPNDPCYEKPTKGKRR